MIAIVDYGFGNLYSLSHALSHLDISHTVTKSAGDLYAADSIVLPGVGAFGDAMVALNKHNMLGPLYDAVSRNAPILGICLGMQVLASMSEEFGKYNGLNIIPGSVKPLPPIGSKDVQGMRIPNVGWRSVQQRVKSYLFKNISQGSMTYFVHSYGFFPDDTKAVIATTNFNGLAVPAIVQHKNIVGCQFHPEKSGPTGLKILQNFFLENKVDG